MKEPLMLSLPNTWAGPGGAVSAGVRPVGHELALHLLKIGAAKRVGEQPERAGEQPETEKRQPRKKRA